MNIFFELMGVYIMGQLLHLFFWDFPQHRQKAKIANVDFKPIDIIKEDWFLWAGNVILGVAIFLVMGELDFINSHMSGKERLLFLLLGGFGSFSIQTRWSRLQAKIDNVIDHKTNIADGKEKPPVPVEPPLTPEP